MSNYSDTFLQCPYDLYAEFEKYFFYSVEWVFSCQIEYQVNNGFSIHNSVIEGSFGKVCSFAVFDLKGPHIDIYILEALPCDNLAEQLFYYTMLFPTIRFAVWTSFVACHRI